MEDHKLISATVIERGLKSFDVKTDFQTKLDDLVDRILIVKRKEKKNII
jgi:hypothetical protein